MIQEKHGFIYFFPDIVPFLFLHELAAKEDSASLPFPTLILNLGKRKQI